MLRSPALTCRAFVFCPLRGWFSPVANGNASGKLPCFTLVKQLPVKQLPASDLSLEGRLSDYSKANLFKDPKPARTIMRAATAAQSSRPPKPTGLGSENWFFALPVIVLSEHCGGGSLDR